MLNNEEQNVKMIERTTGNMVTWVCIVRRFNLMSDFSDRSWDVASFV